MIDPQAHLPLHHLSKNLDPEFNKHLYQYKTPDFVFLVEKQGVQSIFISRMKAKTFFDNYGGTEVLKISVNDVTFNKDLILEPCLSCEFNGYAVNDMQALKSFLCVSNFLEIYFTKLCKKKFEEKNIDELYIISKDILEHYNPSSSLAHFYLGFCFYCFGDIQNYNLALKNLEAHDTNLALKLQELQGLE